MRARLAVFFAILTPAAPLPAQWHVGVEVAATRYGGTSRALSDTAPTLQPGAATMFAVRLDRRFGRWGVVVRAAAGNPGLRAWIADFALEDRSDGSAIEPSAAVTYRVGGIGPSGAVWVEVGPALPLWDIDGDIRSRWGALGAVTYEWTVAGRFRGAVRVDGLVSPSWFEPGDLPDELERRTTWRYGVGLGLRYRL
ncbi:MAG: hypothetical protein ACREMN_07160 [Gemmatimonadales bacterium]